MIAPDHPWRRKWLTFVALVTTYKALETPARIALGHPQHGWFYLSDVLVFAVFAIDIFFYFQTAIVESGRKISDPQKVRKHYLRGWFAIDLLGTIPFSLLFIPLGHLSLFTWLEWLWMLRLGRLWSYTSAVQHQQSSHFLIRRMSVFFFWIAIIVHFTACGWIMVGQGSEGDYPDSFTRYLRSLYWTITTVSTTGYGDIVPKNNLQTVYAMLTMVLGAGIYASFVGNIASILTRVDGARAAYQGKLERLNTFMRYKKLPEVLQRKILNYHAYLWETGLGYDETSLISDLPPSLRKALTLFLNREIIQHVPFFEKATEAVLHQLVSRMESVILTPGDYVFHAGEIGKEMYFVSRGSVEVVSAEGHVYATLREGDYFGEIALLTSSPRTAGVRSVDYSNLYMLQRETFEMILKEFPDFAKQVQETASARKMHE